MDLAERFQHMIDTNTFLVLATSHDSKPWASPVYFAYDSKGHFYFVSRPDSQHATNIRVQPNVSLAIYDSTCTPGQCDGIQIAGTARELNDTDEVEHGANVLLSRRFEDETERAKHLDPSRYQGKAPVRIYEVTQTDTYLVDKGKPNDYRVQLEF